MLKMTAAGVAAFLAIASPPAYAQTPSGGSPSASNLSDVTEDRISIVKDALQLTQDQQKYWPAIQDAIQARAKNREARFASMSERVDKMRDRSPREILQNFNPVDFMQRRAEALAQRASDLKKVADAWQPLYQTLSSEQKRRMALLTVAVLHEIRQGAAPQDLYSQEDEEE